MPKRKTIWDDRRRRAAIRNMLGYRELNRLHIGRRGLELLAEKVKGDRPFKERVFVSILFLKELPLAEHVARQTTGIREAGRMAKAMAVLKELA